MSAGHTAGPWAIKQFGGPQISGPDGYAVATMWGALSVEELSGQDLANARLIAAAPDLLEALQLAVPANVCLTNRNIPDSMIVSLDVPMGDLRKIAAVIARATGEAS